MFSFSSSKLVDRPFDWAYQLEDLGYSGWEIVNEGKQKLTRENLNDAKQIVETTNLTITIHHEPTHLGGDGKANERLPGPRE